MADVPISGLPIADYMGIEDFLPFVQNGVTKRVSRAKMEIAKSGDNTDIRSLGLNPASTTRIVSSGSDVVVSSSDPYENSLGIENKGGGAADLHFYAQGPAGAPVGANRLLGGIGSRPWLGASAGYSDHSTTAIHFLSTEVPSPTAQGAVTKILATLNGTANAGRLCAATFNGYGDIVCGNYAYNQGTNPGRGISVIRTDAGPRNVAEIELIGNGSSYSSLFRGCSIGLNSTYDAPTNTKATQATGLAFVGYDGTAFTNSKALITLRAASAGDWSTTNTPTEITFGTTPAASVTRVERWKISANGNMEPAFDNTVSFGAPSARPSVIYAATGTINTSDAREKTEVRKFTKKEMAVAQAMVKEVGFYKFLLALDDKGESARDHCGLTVQRAIELFESAGLDPFNYSFICYDEWQESLEVVDAEDGSIIKPATLAGNRYSFRESGLMMFMLAGINARLEALEK